MLRERLCVGIPLALVTIVAFTVPGQAGALAFLLLAVLFFWGGMNELFAILARLQIRSFVSLTLAAGLALVAAPWLVGILSTVSPLRLFLADVAIITMYLWFASILVLREGATPANLLCFFVSLGSLLYAAWLPSFLTKLYFLDPGYTNGRAFAFYIVIITKIADVGAFALGSATARRAGGNHKLFPRISPKKSWEGLAGGIFLSVAVSILGAVFFGDVLCCWSGRGLTIPAAIVWGILATLVGLLGDLLESALKRASNTKDSGRIPGLGGVLDILDSLIPVAPIFFIYVCSTAMLS